jgi:hypothetical protein
MNEVGFEKLKLTLRHKIQGMAYTNKKYNVVLKAFNLAEKYHNGKRKDGQPEFSHQLMIVAYLLTIEKSLVNAPMVILAALWHDLYEDYYDEFPEVVDEMKAISEEGFIYSYRLAKVRDGEKISYEQYFKEMTSCIICSIVKLVDRASNISTMVGIFTVEKQTNYLDELNMWFFPMLKQARRLFPEQESAYENIKTILIIQRDTITKMRVIEKEKKSKTIGVSDLKCDFDANKIKFQKPEQISYHESDKKTCGFNMGYAGRCASKEVLENGQCKAHQNMCCICKEQLAIESCAHSGQFVCGAPTCDKCNHYKTHK